VFTGSLLALGEAEGLEESYHSSARQGTGFTISIPALRIRKFRARAAGRAARTSGGKVLRLQRMETTGAGRHGHCPAGCQLVVFRLRSSDEGRATNDARGV